MEVQGTIKKLGNTQTFGNNGFRKRELVVTTYEKYPQDLLIEFTQDKCELLDSYMVGQNVKVDINLRGREWVNPQGETKYFNSINGWRIETIESDISKAAATIDAAFPPATEWKETDNDLPF